jgi:signal peptidase I
VSETEKKTVVREYTEAIIVAVVLALFIRTFVFQAFKIPSGSMLPTLQIGDHLLVNKFIYGIKVPYTGALLVPITKPDHGDVIVFRYPEDKSLDYIKRVVAVPGDTLEIKNKQVFINGIKTEDSNAHFTDQRILPEELKDPRIFKGGPNKDNFGPILIPDGKWFVMGDNRDNSYDSRFWGFVDENLILGKAMIIYWSWDIDKPLFSVDRLTSIRFSRLGDIIH